MSNYQDKKIKFAVIGCGHIGMRHAEMIRRNEESELVAICDVLPKNDLKLGESSDTPFYLSPEEMLVAHPEIDVVNVCSPNGLHAKHSLIALENRKHIVCEKPMALTKADCEKIIYKALQVSRTVFGVMQNRYSPPSEWLKSVVEKKLIGEIFLVQLNCFWNRDDRYYKKGGWKGTSDLDGGTLADGGALVTQGASGAYDKNGEMAGMELAFNRWVDVGRWVAVAAAEAWSGA